LAAIGLVCALAAPAKADPKAPGELFGDPGLGEPRDLELVLDQAPYPYAGFGSDTEFRDGFGQPTWQRMADDIELASQATIARVVWFGFFGGDFPPTGSWYPPETETMRIRFLHVDPTSGLPDESNVLYEESFLNPFHEWTGRYVILSSMRPEYRYQVDLGLPVDLEYGVPYWLEVVQMGDLDSHFRWELGIGVAGPLASINSVHPWQYVGTNLNNALQLWAIPEPATLGFLSFVAGRMLHRPRGRRCCM
jgi:hypothetical protein